MESAIRILDENDIIDAVLTPEEFQRMVSVLLDYLKPMLRCAFRTGMSNAEILNLTLDSVDQRANFTRLRKVWAAFTAMKVTGRAMRAVSHRYISCNEPDLPRASTHIDTYINRPIPTVMTYDNFRRKGH